MQITCCQMCLGQFNEFVFVSKNQFLNIVTFVPSWNIDWTHNISTVGHLRKLGVKKMTFQKYVLIRRDCTLEQQIVYRDSRLEI